MRRSGPHGDMPRPEVSLGGVRLSGVDRRIFNDDKPLELSPREFAVLEMLLLRHGRVVSKAQLQDHLTHFGGDLGDTAIEVYVHRVRKKLENCRVEIVTVRGFGYLLAGNPAGRVIGREGRERLAAYGAVPARDAMRASPDPANFTGFTVALIPTRSTMPQPCRQ